MLVKIIRYITEFLLFITGGSTNSLLPIVIRLSRAVLSHQQFCVCALARSHRVVFREALVGYACCNRLIMNFLRSRNSLAFHAFDSLPSLSVCNKQCNNVRVVQVSTRLSVCHSCLFLCVCALYYCLYYI